MLPLKLICKENEVRKDGKSVVYIQYCFSSAKRTNLNTTVAIPARYWDEKTQSIKKSLPAEYGNITELSRTIKTKYRIAEDLVDLANEKNILNKGVFVKNAFEQGVQSAHIENDQARLKELAEELEVKQKVDLNVYHQLEDYIKIKTGKVSAATITVIKNVALHLKAFENFRSEPITFKSFDFNFYDRYVDFLTYEYNQPRFRNPIVGMKLNTIGKTIKHLKMFLKDRAKRKIIPLIDLTDYKVPEEETDSIYLTPQEIEKMYRVDLSSYPYLIPYQNLFVLACLTGLRFSDFSTLSMDDVRNNRIYKKQNKSESWVVIPMKEEVKQILTGKFLSSMPYMANADFNEKIKIIGKLAGMVQPIRFSYKKGNRMVEVTKAKCDWIMSHTARRSFCTNEFLAGTPVKLIMMISGHRREKDFYRYIRVSPEEAAKTLEALWIDRSNGQTSLPSLSMRP